jgi:hypothetical protein
MSKRRNRAPAAMDDFRPLYLKDGKLWVPYRSGDDWYLHYLTPDKAWLVINNALAVVGKTGVVVPFTMATLSGRKEA